MKFYLVLVLSLIILNANAKPSVAIVIKIRGNATQLVPGEMQARKLKLGDRLKEDASILTAKRSFARIQFIKDETKLNIGPNSKIIVMSSKSNEPTLIGLLKGKIRAKVTRDKRSSKNKFFVKTRQAALGVRGTDFQTIYNPSNKITSLVTFKGEVAMVKTEDVSKHIVKNETVTDISRSSKNINSINVNKIKPELHDTTENLNKMLSDKSTVIVKKGQYSGTYQGLSKVSKPVNINPNQLNTLYKNNNLIENNNKNITKQALDDVDVSKLQIKAVRQDTPAEGFFNKKTGDFAPKSGGVIDINTGIYIPPSKNSLFDSKTGVYLDKNIGSIDKRTGEYVAPKGLKLDAKKGFIISKNNKDKKLQKDLEIQKAALNSNIEKDIVLGVNKNVFSQNSIKYYNNFELLAHQYFSISISSSNENLGENSPNGQYNPRSFPGGNENLAFLFTWKQMAIKNWQPILKFGYKNIKYQNNDSNLSWKTDNYINLYAGLNKVISNRLTVDFYGEFEQSSVIASVLNPGPSEPNSLATKITYSRLGSDLNYNLINGNKFKLGLLLGIFTQLKSEADGVKVGQAIGSHMGFNISMWWSKKLMTKLKVDFKDWKSDYTYNDNSGTEKVLSKLPFKLENAPGIEFVYIL